MDEIIYKSGNENIEDVKFLFNQYSKIKGAEYCFTSFEQELEKLETIYSLPKSNIIIAYINNKPIGCVAIKQIDSFTCEMKRLYVNTQYRKMGIGKELINRVILFAKNNGYKILQLETLPVIMSSAICLYKKIGFKETLRNNDILKMSIEL